MRNISSIAIVLGDNDFGSTFRNLLHTCLHILQYRDYVSEVIMEKIIRDGIIFHYFSFQHHFDEEEEMAFDILEKYFSEIKILFNKNADDAYCKEDHNHGAWHLHVESGQVSSF